MRATFRTWAGVGLLAVSLRADIIRVDAERPPGGNGATWSNAAQGLRDALALALATPGADEIWVRRGVQRPDRVAGISSGDRLAAFVIPAGVEVYGGFAGTESLRTQRNPDPRTNDTVLSGDIGVVGLSADNSYHIVVGDLGGGVAILDGFTIRDGRSDALVSPDFHGAGFYSNGGGMLLSRCRFLNNTAAGQGGGVYADADAVVAISLCEFESNTALRGGAIACIAAHVSLLTCELRGNHATAAGIADESGGGVRLASDAGFVIDDCTFDGNTGGRLGGAMVVSGGDGTISRSRFWMNRAADNGGALLLNGTAVSVSDTLFGANLADGSADGSSSGGAVRVDNGADATFLRCTFDDNRSDSGVDPDFGGAMSCVASAGNAPRVTLTQCVFLKNQSDVGGAISTQGAAPDSLVSLNLQACRFEGNVAFSETAAVRAMLSATSIVGSEFIGNRAVGSGGAVSGVGFAAGAPSTLSVHDSIFSDNTCGSFGGAVRALNVTGGGVTLDVVGGRFVRNAAVFGGAIHVQGAATPIGSASLCGSRFESNVATMDGGAVRLNGMPAGLLHANLFYDNFAGRSGGAVAISGSSGVNLGGMLAGNRAREFGGAILISTSANVNVASTVITGCTAPSGGGAIAIVDSQARVVNASVTGNSASDGGAVLVQRTAAGVLGSAALSNVILWRNFASDGPEVAVISESAASPATLAASYCDIEGGAAGVFSGGGSVVTFGAGIRNENPQFLDPDGLDDDLGTLDDMLRLAGSSPLLDAGDNTAVPVDAGDVDDDGDTLERWPLDVRAVQRFAEDAAPNTGVPDGVNPPVDMGAFEARPCPGGLGCGPGDVNDDCAVSLDDIAVVLSNFGALPPQAPTEGDRDGDGDVDLSDLAVILASFGLSCR
jgi:predicted outer membrane repeat protein